MRVLDGEQTLDFGGAGNPHPQSTVVLDDFRGAEPLDRGQNAGSDATLALIEEKQRFEQLPVIAG